jgi:hypothetical protein
VPKTELWKAVAIASDIEPEDLLDYTPSGQRTDFDPDGTRDFDMTTPHPVGFSNLLLIAESHLGDGLKVLKMVEGKKRRKHFSIVGLADFSDWATKEEIELPKDFPRPTAKTEAATAKVDLVEEANPPKVEGIPGQVSVLLPHMTTTLEAVFRIMREYWTKYDPRNPPKQSVIASDIDQALGWKSQRSGEPSRNAGTLAAAIRRDDVSEADNRNHKRRSDGTFRR